MTDKPKSFRRNVGYDTNNTMLQAPFGGEGLQNGKPDSGGYMLGNNAIGSGFNVAHQANDYSTL